MTLDFECEHNIKTLSGKRDEVLGSEGRLIASLQLSSSSRPTSAVPYTTTKILLSFPLIMK
jgi:hypothetical protein